MALEECRVQHALAAATAAQITISWIWWHHNFIFMCGLSDSIVGLSVV